MTDKQKLALDLDGVLYPFVKAIETYCRVNKGYNNTTDYFYRNVHKLFELYDVDWLVDSPDVYYKFIPDKEMMQLLNELSNKFQIFYITSRPIELQRVTEKYLRDFKFPQNNNLIMSKDKATYARLLGISYFVEDNVSNAQELSKTCTSFLLRTPYNEYATGNFIMINSLNDLKGLLL